MGKTKGILDLLGKPIGALGDLMKSKTKNETVDPTRRKIVAGTVAAPLAAGALSGIPQKVAQKVSDTVSISQAPSGVKISESDMAKLIEEVTPPPSVFDQSIFDGNIQKELSFVKDLFKASTGKNISTNDLIEKELAEYLYFLENGNYNIDNVVNKVAGHEPIFRIADLEELEGMGLPIEEINAIAKKHMGKADGYSYGQVSGSKGLISRIAEAENPDFANLDEEGLADWIKSKGIHKRPYYKNLIKADAKIMSKARGPF
jgi:hypothetical protein